MRDNLDAALDLLDEGKVYAIVSDHAYLVNIVNNNDDYELNNTFELPYNYVMAYGQNFLQSDIAKINLGLA